MRSLITLLCCAFLPATALAHHSRSEFSGEFLELEGRIVDLFWSNPHPHVAINVTESDGSQRLWRVEMWSNLFGTERAGVSGERFVEGDILRVAGRVSTRRDGYIVGDNLLFTDGWEAVLKAGSEPRWTDRILSSAQPTTVDANRREQVIQENRGLFRVWTPVEFYPAYAAARQFPFTDEALAARDDWDPLSNYLTRCEQPGLPLTMMSPQEYELIDEGDTIRIRAQFFDTTRTVHMTNEPSSESRAASHLGYSVGSWDGDTLVVETSRIDWPFFDTLGTPQSSDIRIVERFTLSDDQSTLNFQMSIDDSATLEEPSVYEVNWAALGGTIREYNCRIYPG